MTYRKARPGDVDAIMELQQTSEPNPWSKGAWETLLQPSPTMVRVAEQQGQMVAYAAYRSIPPEAELLHIAVAQTHRRQGIARGFLIAVQTELQACGIRTIHLEVRKSNQAAIRLYQSLSYKASGQRRDYYQNPREDAILMTYYNEEQSIC